LYLATDWFGFNRRWRGRIDGGLDGIEGILPQAGMGAATVLFLYAAAVAEGAGTLQWTGLPDNATEGGKDQKAGEG
jgi:hypothetical protein